MSRELEPLKEPRGLPDNEITNPTTPVEWMPLTRGLFPQDSPGYLLFPDILEGRERPVESI